MNKILIVALAALALGALFTATQKPNKVDAFEAWKAKHNKFYAPSENSFRLGVYLRNMEIIEAHNADPTQTYWMAENQFTALTDEEFVATYLTYKPSTEIVEVEEEPATPIVGAANWSSSVVVKNQGNCGSCWAFSATGAIESFLKITKGTTVSLSEQQLVDCDTASFGCDGGYPDKAISYAAKNGLASESAYPYKGVDGTCSAKTGSTKVTGFKRVSATQAALQGQVSKYPVSVCVDATNWSKYGGGTFNNCAKSINHAVLAVGWNDNGTWIVKNSWGTSWGEKGFITLAAGDTCGVLQQAVYAY